MYLNESILISHCWKLIIKMFGTPTVVSTSFGSIYSTVCDSYIAME